MSESESTAASRTGSEKTRNPARPAAIAVVLILLALVAYYALSDRLAPSSSRGTVSAKVVQIAPRIGGQVTAVAVNDDAVVEAGKPLFRIDSRPFELAVEQAEAELASTAQSIDASTAALVAAQAAVTQARSKLDTTRADTDRILRLAERGLVSAADADAARARLADARSGLRSAQANLESARAELGPKGRDNPAILAAQARLEQAQYDLASTTVKAPHFGVVTNVTLSEGQFISAGSPAMTFIDAQAAWVTVDFRENQLRAVDPGDRVRLLFDAVPGRIFEGRVQSIAWGIDPGRSSQGGLVVNQPNNRWFEPARRIPVRIELAEGMDAWPQSARVGGKVHAVVFAGGALNPIALIGRALQRMRSWTSYLH